MISSLKYKNYVGSIEFSKEDNIYYGKVQGIKSLVSYEGATLNELIEDFRGAVDDYLALCEDDENETSSKAVNYLSLAL